jgi:hypothetical protein
MSTNDEIVQQARAAVEAISRHAKADPNYGARFRAEPVAVLLQAGAPAETVAEILREAGMEQEEVSGYLLFAGISPSLSLGSPLGSAGRGLPTSPLGAVSPLAGTAGSARLRGSRRR